jgi:hypothetical protein
MASRVPTTEGLSCCYASEFTEGLWQGEASVAVQQVVIVTQTVTLLAALPSKKHDSISRVMVQRQSYAND